MLFTYIRALFSRHNILLASVGLATVAFLAYFRRFTEFGLYGDDHAFFGGLINRSWSEEFAHLKWCLINWPQGRPLGMGGNLSLLPHIIYSLGGITGLHFVGFLIVSVNGALIYRVLRMYHPPLIAWCAAGFYVLAPVDTVQNSLVYAYNFEIAVTMCLLATIAALQGRNIRFLFFLAAGFLMVEPVAMFALFAPFCLGARLDRTWGWWSIRHTIRWAGTVLTILICRWLIGDPWGSERVSEIAASPLATFKNGLTTAITGFQTHFDLLAERLAQPFKEADLGVATTMLAVGALSGVVIWLIESPSINSAAPNNPSSIISLEPSRIWTGIWMLAIGGFIIMLAVYFAYFRAPWTPAHWRTGFMSGVHVIAELGSCLVFASSVAVASRLLPSRLHRAAYSLPVVVLAAFAGFGELVQRDYASSWSFQRNFWKTYAVHCADATDSTFVLVLDHNLPQVRYIDLFSWGTEILPDALFQYCNMTSMEKQTERENEGISTRSQHTLLPEPPPASDSEHVKSLARPPSVILTARELATAIRCEGQQYFWKPTYYFMLPKTSAQQPDAGNVIVLTYDAQGSWQRITGEIAVEGGVLPLREVDGHNSLLRVRKKPLATVYGL